MQDDLLLTQYDQNGSEAAFSQLLARHMTLVYGTCRRALGSQTQAEDAAQVVFLLLARNAPKLRTRQSLAGWLYQTAVFVSKNAHKQEARRLRKEEAAMQEVISQQRMPDPAWSSVEPLLNAALSSLKPADREAVLLRFLEGQTLAETGTALGISEDAARMRVTRAVEKLRRYLTAHGAAVTGLILTGLLTSEAAHPVPAHAAEVITQGTLQAISTGPTANVLLLSKGIYHTMKIAQLKIAALTTAVLIAGAAVPPLAHALSHRQTVRQAVPPARMDLPDTPQTVLALLNKAQAAADADKTITADFSYVVTDPIGGSRKDIGTIKLMKPNYAAISYNTGLPTAAEIHSDGKTVWNYRPASSSYKDKVADPQGNNINVWRLITIGSFFSVDTWVRQGIYADPSELHYLGRQTVDSVDYQVLEHKMVGTMYGKDVPFDQKVFIGPDHLIHRFTMDFAIDGKPGTEYADLTNIHLGTPMQPADFAYAPPVGAILPTQTIVLQHVVPLDIVKSQNWDQAASLPAGVTKVEAVSDQNALLVTATPEGFAKVQEIIKSLDVEPRQVQIQAAYADVTEADLGASGVNFSLVPLDKPQAGSTPVLVRYASGSPAVGLLQTLTKQQAVKLAPDITTTNTVTANIHITTKLSSGQTASTEFSVTPRINSDNSVTLALRLTLSDGTVKREISTLRTVANGDTIVIVKPPDVSQPNGKNLLLFVTPTFK
jgi:RNA polymerase sigma factor (sigma-70 family)